MQTSAAIKGEGWFSGKRGSDPQPGPWLSFNYLQEQLMRCSAKCLTLALPFHLPGLASLGLTHSNARGGCAQRQVNQHPSRCLSALHFVFIHQSAQHPAPGFQAENDATDLFFWGTLFYCISAVTSFLN